MRNGNSSGSPIVFTTFVEFLPYLWGMETVKELQKRGVVHFQFLPYLWGMETQKETYTQASSHSSYRTYEEWKPTTVTPMMIAATEFLPYLWGMETLFVHRCKRRCYSSYRTYEEWKLFLNILWRGLKISSYRTYEEWKQSKHLAGKHT